MQSEPGNLSGRPRPVTGRKLQIEAHHVGIILLTVAVRDAGVRIEIPADGTHPQLFAAFHRPFHFHTGSVEADVDGGRKFKRLTAANRELQKHTHRYTGFGSSCRVRPSHEYTSTVVGKCGLGQIPPGECAEVRGWSIVRKRQKDLNFGSGFHLTARPYATRSSTLAVIPLQGV